MGHRSRTLSSILTFLFFAFSPPPSCSAGSGTLYAVTGDGANSNPETLYTLNQTTGAPTLVRALGNGGDGETIAFNPDDGLLYHFSGDQGPTIFEKIDPVTGTTTNIPLSGDADGTDLCEVSALYYRSSNVFYAATICGDFLTVTTSGQVTIINDFGMDHNSKGLVLAGSTLFSVNPANSIEGTYSPLLSIINPATGNNVSSIPVTIAGDTITTFTGLAPKPGSTQLFALAKLESVPGQSRSLVLIDPATGVATLVGNTGNAFATLAMAAALTSANLSLTKTGAPSPVAVNGTITYQLTVANAGPDQATNVSIVDILPPGTTFLSASSGCNAAGSTVTCALGSLASSSNASVMIQARAPSTAGVVTNNATVSASESDPNLNNNSASATTTVQSLSTDLSISKSASATTVFAGDQLVFTITVRNLGPDPATGVVITDPLPAGLSFVSASSGCTPSSGVVTCTIGNLALNATATVTITALTGTQGGTIVNTASVTGNEAEPVSSNNSASSTFSNLGIRQIPTARRTESDAPGGIARSSITAGASQMIPA